MSSSAVRDRGSSALLVLVVCATLSVATLGAIATFGNDTLDHARAQSAADASALAGLSGGRRGSAAIASRNGGRLVSWRTGPRAGEVTVAVRVGDVVAEARASDAP